MGARLTPVEDFLMLPAATEARAAHAHFNKTIGTNTSDVLCAMRRMRVGRERWVALYMQVRGVPRRSARAAYRRKAQREWLA